MQPVLKDLELLQDTWNSTIPVAFHSRQSIENRIRFSQRPVYLRVLHVALLALMVSTFSASLCLNLAGVTAAVKGAGAFGTLTKLFLGIALGFVSYELFILQDITDRCRSLFREAVHALNHGLVTAVKKQRWDRMTKKIEQDYRQLYCLDVVLDTLYPIVLNH